MEQFTQTFEKEFDPCNLVTATETWEVLRDTMDRTALATFGKKSSKSHDWFEAKSVMTPVIEAKRAALTEYKRTPSERNLQIFRIARSKAQQTARRCAKEYWTELRENIQSAAITGNIRGMYDGIKKALGPTLNKTAPLRSSTGEVITDRGHHRWLGHVYRMEDGRIPKDILYGELEFGRRSKGRPQLRYKDVCKRDMKALDINTESWEDLAADRMMWRSTLNQHLKTGEKKLVIAEAGRRARRKERNNSNRPKTTHKCDFCGRDCFSHIGLYSHKRRCNNRTDRTSRMYSQDQT